MTDTNFTTNPAEPELLDVLNQFKKQIFLDMNCHAIGTIQDFDSSNQSCKITINYKKTFYKKDVSTGQLSPYLVDYPVLLDCPVIMLSGGLLSLRMPVKKGDACLVFFNDRDMDAWVANGETQKGPPSNRLHSFADAIALVGLHSFSAALEDFLDETAELTDGTSALRVGGATSKAGLYNGEDNTAVEVTSSKARMTNGLLMAIEVNASKLKLTNSITTLGIELTNLLTALNVMLTAMSAADNTNVPATVAAPAAAALAVVVTVQTQLTGLLE